MKALFDTNILIDYLNGIEASLRELSKHDERLISPISWMEVMVGTLQEEEADVRAFLSTFRQVSIDSEVAEEAVVARRTIGLKLPDAIIWASARVSDALLVTRKDRDFPADHPGVRNPYEL